jgi:uncharacterized protein
MNLPRYYDDLESYIQPGKALLIYGPRRVGKTTLVADYLKKTKWKYKLDSGDNIRTQHTLSSQDFSLILPYAENHDLIVIDEAQNIPNIGITLKILVDQKPRLRIIATGSSSFELAGQVGEPLTGRKRTLTLYPVAQQELLMNTTWNRLELTQNVSNYLIYGAYPEILTAKSQKQKIDIIDEIVNSYLLKDIFNLETIKASKTLFSLLKLLAFQIGAQVSLNELSNTLDINIRTVARYLDLLEKAFVITSLTGYSSNLREEITSKAKYYFLDTGIRNGIIQQYQEMDSRSDVGQLWENFIFIERMKHRQFASIHANSYFWRTYSQQEVDIVEERNGKLFGYECKWSEKKHISTPKEWMVSYPEASFQIINRNNFLDFIT